MIALRGRRHSRAAALAFTGITGMVALQGQVAGQASVPEQANPIDAVVRQVEELNRAVSELREQLAQSRLETQALREELRASRPASPSESQVPGPAALATLADDQRLIAAKVDDQYQTKVASGSRYHLQLSGLVLFNAFDVRGTVDNLDVPGVARNRSPSDSAGAFGASLRQTQLTLRLAGPRLAGASTSGEVTADFFGGFPATPEAVTAGLMRLRTARIGLDWKDTSLIAGQETPFFSPLSPTSLVSAAYPALGGAGNIWTWTPQIRVEHRVRLSEDSALVLQGGLLDPLSGELPASEYDRMPTAGESSRNPAWAARLGWQNVHGQQNSSFGFGGYFSRQDWGFGRSVNAWATTADWDLPLGPWLAVSGELYRGQSIAGLGGGESPGVFFRAETGDPATLQPAKSAGGWMQLKYHPTEMIEFNTAFGEDQVFHFSRFQLSQAGPIGSPVGRNSSGFANFIYRPRTNLAFSLEYRRLWTRQLEGPEARASQIGAAAGVIF